MRNLKKVLALALAVVMLVGMMAMGAGAATYADDADISYKTAVEVMSAIGVLNGTGDNFEPNGNLTRAAGAKIIAYVALTKTNAEKLALSATGFSDVAADHWASGSIAYCYNQGIVSGNGDGTFNPNGELSGYAFAKMLLGVLGYDADIEGYQNHKDWALNINFDALDAGLLAGLETIDMGATMTREQAAQMAFNALTATMVGYTGGTSITFGDTTITTGATLGAKLAGVNDWSNGFATGDATLQLCEYLYPALEAYKTAAAANTIGKVEWTLDGNTTQIVTVADKAAFVYENVVTDNAAGTAAGTAITRTFNGYAYDAVVPVVDGVPTGTVADVDDLSALNALSTKVEVYTRMNGTTKTVCAVVVTTKPMVTVTADYDAVEGEYVKFTVAAADGNGYTYADVNAPAPGAQPTAMYTALCALGLENAETIDLLVNVAYDTTNTVHYLTGIIGEPEVVSGTTTKFVAGKSVTIDGVEYKNAPLYVQTNAPSVIATANANKQTVVLDAYGNVLELMNTPAAGGAAVTIPNFIYILEHWTETDARLGSVVYIQYVDMNGNVAETAIDASSTVTLSGASGETNVPALYTVNPLTGLWVVADLSVAGTPAIGAVSTSSTLTGTELQYSTYYVSDDVKSIYINEQGYTNAVTDTLVTVVDGQPKFTTSTAYTYVVAVDANGVQIVTHIFSEAAPYVAPSVEDGIIFVDSTNSTVKYVIPNADGTGTLNAFDVIIDGVETEIFTSDASIANGFWTYEIEASGNYKLTTYHGSPVNVVEDDTITSGDLVLVNGKYYLDGTQDITDAVIYNETNSNVSTLAAILVAVQAGKTLTLNYVEITTAAGVVVPFIYVTNVA